MDRHWTVTYVYVFEALEMVVMIVLHCCKQDLGEAYHPKL